MCVGEGVPIAVTVLTQDVVRETIGGRGKKCLEGDKGATIWSHGWGGTACLKGRTLRFAPSHDMAAVMQHATSEGDRRTYGGDGSGCK